MSYLVQAALAADNDIAKRVTACAASENIPDPSFWAQQHAWQLSAQPGWADAYADSSNENPGADEDAITDEMILERVRELIAAETSPELPEEEES